MFPKPDILIFEPRVEGHHLTWLRYVTDDFLSAGFKVALALDGRPRCNELIGAHLSDLMSRVSVISAFDRNNGWRGGDKLGALAACIGESGAQDLFMNNLDEVASHLLRLAAAGIHGPRVLRGRLNGVYFRPRFLTCSWWAVNHRIKAAGFRRLSRQGWFKKIYLMDDSLVKMAKDRYPGPSFHHLPDPWSGDFSLGQKDARAALGVPSDKFVVLHYGIASRRKGLHLAVRALLVPPVEPGVFLLCAGQPGRDREVAEGLAELQRRGLAKNIDHYVSEKEEQLCFCASDAVLMPYIGHFGSSGVLSRAAAAGKAVIASDEGLVARRVGEHRLGWLFPTRNVHALKQKLLEAMVSSPGVMAGFRQSALKYALSCSREAFRAALLSPYRC